MKYRMWTEIDYVGRFINVDDIKYFKLAKLPRRNDGMYMALKGTSRIEQVISVDLWSTNITHPFVFE